MLKFEGIPVGTKIRAYDFEPRPGVTDKYIEGEIVGLYDKEYRAYIVNVEKDTLYPDNPRIDVFVPFEISLMEFDERVTIID